MKRMTLSKKCIFVGLALFLSAIYIASISLKSISDGSHLKTIATACLCLVLTSLSFVALHVASQNPAGSHTLRTLISQYLIQLLLIRRGSSAYRRLVASSKDLALTQDRILRQILCRNRNTKYGLDHDFHGIISPEDFVQKVPLTVYSDYAPYLSEIVNREDSSDVLTADPVVFLATSSGTTGKNKTIPLTSFTRTMAVREVGPLMCLRQASITGLDLQRVLALGYRSETTRSPSGLSLGPVSAHIGRVPPYSVAPREVYDITDEQVALHLHAIYGLAEEDVGRMEALFSTLVYSFWRYIDSHWMMICDEIETGTLSQVHSDGEPIPEELRAFFRGHFRPQPDRASRLRDEFRKGFSGIAMRVWPRLKLVRMVTSGAFAHHARLLGSMHMRGVRQLSPVHAASEGFFGINAMTSSCSMKDADDEQRYTLLPDYGFFEFIEERRLDEDQPETVLAHQVRVNESYEIVYTSQTGLYRYRMGDVVRIVGFLNDCPTYEFVHRSGQMLNLYWEKTPEAVFYRAICRVFDSLEGHVLLEYAATEDLFVPPSLTDSHSTTTKHYVLFLEVDHKETEARLDDETKKKFDDVLRLEFDLYDQLRRSNSIGPMRVYQVRRGAFSRGARVRQQRRRPAMSLSGPQYKVPRVVRDPEFLELLIAEIITS